jgi:RNA polymerase sigma-54 factor
LDHNIDNNQEQDEHLQEQEQEDFASKEDEFDYEDYYDDDDIPDYRLKINNRSSDDEQKEIPFSGGITFHEFLKQQLGFRKLDEKKYQIGLYIIGNIDDSGYLERSTESMVDDLAFTQNIETTKEEVEEVLSVIQDFDPPGVGARDLQECLLLQLKRKKSPEVCPPLLVDANIDGEFLRKVKWVGENILNKNFFANPLMAWNSPCRMCDFQNYCTYGSMDGLYFPQ